MVNGYLTYDELKLISGLDEKLLNKLIRDGLTLNEIEYIPCDIRYNNMSQSLFNYDQVQRWIGLHIY